MTPASEPGQKLDALQRVVDGYQSVLVAFSGGIDSTLVLHVAHDRLGPDAVAVTAVSDTLPQREREACAQLVREIGARHVWHHTDQLAMPEFIKNDATRCYHCKTDLYAGLETIRRELGLRTIANGVQLDDLGDDRPGIQAAKDWQVRSPLVEAALTKEDVRAVARLVGLSIWDKPAAACLSSRIPRGLPITRDALARIEQAEAILMEAGFRQVRVRDYNGSATIEVGAEELQTLLHSPERPALIARVAALGFEAVEIDPEGYRPGKANRAHSPLTVIG